MNRHWLWYQCKCLETQSYRKTMDGSAKTVIA